LKTENRTGIVSFTATRWGQLLNQNKIPKGENVPTAIDCYRFVLTNQNVDICMMGTKNMEEMRENLKILEMGPMNENEMNWMKRIGDYIYGKK
jgi:predicted aldo/keto reductase-like oxidoreductase